MKTSSFLLSLLCVSLTFIPAIALAKTINLYAEPKADAKVVQPIDLSVGIIPIFTPKEGGWMKVADPKNGNVGWIKSSDLSNAGPITFTQQIINNGKTPNAYQIIQFGQPSQLTSEQIQKIQMQQQTIQQNMQKAVQDLVKDLNNLYQYHQQLNNTASVPMIMPKTGAQPSNTNK